MERRDDRLYTVKRQMDFLILEELACSPSFGRWFLEKTGHTGPGTLELLRLLQSDSTNDGETDFLVVHSTAAGSRALLIDNSLGAGCALSRTKRHRTRGQAGIATGCWLEFATVLTAPRHFLAEVKGVFDCKVSYETIGQAIAAHGDPARIACKLKLLDWAIARSKKTPRSCWRGGDNSL